MASKTPSDLPESNSMVHAVNSSLAVPVGPDFSDAADKALNVVVQINAQESEKLARQKWIRTIRLATTPFSGI